MGGPSGRTPIRVSPACQGFLKRPSRAAFQPLAPPLQSLIWFLLQPDAPLELLLQGPPQEHQVLLAAQPTDTLQTFLLDSRWYVMVASLPRLYRSGSQQETDGSKLESEEALRKALTAR